MKIIRVHGVVNTPINTPPETFQNWPSPSDKDVPSPLPHQDFLENLTVFTPLLYPFRRKEKNYTPIIPLMSKNYYTPRKREDVHVCSGVLQYGPLNLNFTLNSFSSFSSWIAL